MQITLTIVITQAGQYDTSDNDAMIGEMFPAPVRTKKV